VNESLSSDYKTKRKLKRGRPKDTPSSIAVQKASKQPSFAKI
jgi:hypothetical protein